MATLIRRCLALGSLAVCLSLGCRSSTDRARTEARSRFAAAWGLYEEENAKATPEERRERYEAALREFQALRKPPFDRTGESAKASVMIPACQARLAAMAGGWAEVGLLVDKARENLAQLERQAERETELAEFLQAFDLHYIVNGYVVREAPFGAVLAKAEECLRQKDYAGAIEIVEDVLFSGSLAREGLDLDRAYRFLVKVRGEQFRVGVRAEIDRGHEAAGKFLDLVKRSPSSPAAQARFDVANTAYRKALDLLNSGEARVLPDEELAAMKEEAGAGKRRLATASENYRLLSGIEEGPRRGDKQKELGPSDAVPAPVRKRQADVTFAKILEYIDSGQPALAICELEKFVKAHPEHPKAKDLLEALRAHWRRHCMILRGDGAMKDKKWEEAKREFQAASRLQGEPALDKKIRLCQYHIDLAKADAAYQARKYAEAEALYSTMVQAYPEHSAVLHARLIALQREVRNRAAAPAKAPGG